MNRSTPERMLAEFTAGGDVSVPSARAHARMLLADALVLAQATAPVRRFDAVHELGAGTGEHLSWATGRMLGACDAVAANATAVHARFQDDTDMSTWSHPASFVIPAAVAAVTEANGTVGDVLDALTVGYAATSWLGGAGAVAEPLKARGFRPSPSFAPLGAAIAAIRGLHGPTDAALHAINAAALIGRGTLHSVGNGGDDWRLHNAGAARDGFSIALAAARGMRSAADGLTAHNGFLRSKTGDEKAPDTWATAPSAELILGVWHKALPVLGDVVAAALAARAMPASAAWADGSVTVRMNAKYAAFPGTQTRPPYESATAAQASVRFVVAHLLVHGDLRYEDLERPADAAVLRIAEAMEVVPDDALDFEDAIVEIEHAGERLVRRTAELPRTFFWRDRDEQLDRARHVLGDQGAAIADEVLDADESTAAQALIRAAVLAQP